LIRIKAVFFDLHGTLVYRKSNSEPEVISKLLFKKHYVVSPQQFEAATQFVSIIDYPRYGYRDWRSYLRRIFWRLKVKVDAGTLHEVAQILECNPYLLYPDAAEAAMNAHGSGLRTAIVTTIARFKFESAIHPIRNCFDFVMTGYEAGVDKSNPGMYLKLLKMFRLKPSEAIMIGDDLRLDILLPRQLGIRSILLDRGGKNQAKEVYPIVRDLNEAMNVILSLNRRIV
jgi:FMN phosphatase YigB (HAD superfamily)